MPSFNLRLAMQVITVDKDAIPTTEKYTFKLHSLLAKSRFAATRFLLINKLIEILYLNTIALF
jgi:hypothetical protein